MPQVTAFYHLHYTMDQSKADAVVRLVRHVLASKGLEPMMEGQRDEL